MHYLDLFIYLVCFLSMVALFGPAKFRERAQRILDTLFGKGEK